MIDKLLKIKEDDMTKKKKKLALVLLISLQQT